MTDLEMTRLCAEAMGIVLAGETLLVRIDGRTRMYWPLHDDAQAMALVKKLDLNLQPHVQEWADDSGRATGGWAVSDYTGEKCEVFNPDLNRAIVECVARMQAAKNA